jgi:hypothetical protein
MRPSRLESRAAAPSSGPPPLGVRSANERLTGGDQAAAGTANFLELHTRASHHEPGARLFVWAFWAVLLSAAFSFVVRNGSSVPYWDEWVLVPALTGHQPLTLEYLWAQHNEHRIPVPRLILVGLARLFHVDLRAGLILNVLVQGLVAAALVLAARKLRGRTIYADAFIPLALLNLGHHANFESSFQVGFVLSEALACALLAIIACNRRLSRFATVFPAGACLLLLPYLGAQGLALVPALALCFLASAIAFWRLGAGRPRLLALVKFIFTALAIASVLLYFRGLTRIGDVPTGPGLRAALRTSLEFLTDGFGPVLKSTWPASGIAVGGLLGATVLLIVANWLKRPGERLRALGLLLFLGAMVSLALAVGWGRSGLGPKQAFLSRYTTSAVPLLIAVYFAWELYGGRVSRPFVQASLLAMACIVLWPNAQLAEAQAHLRRRVVKRFEHDLQSRMRACDLVDRYQGCWPLLPDPKEQSLAQLLMLNRAGARSFRHLAQPRVFTHDQESPILKVALPTEEIRR